MDFGVIMDMHGLRTLNLIGSLSFMLIGSLLAITQSTNIFMFPDSIFTPLFLIWIALIFIFGILIYRYTVLGLDRNESDLAKKWTLFGIIIGFMGGIIPQALFILSYVSFDNAVYGAQFAAPPDPGYPPGRPNTVCTKCQDKYILTAYSTLTVGFHQCREWIHHEGHDRFIKLI